MSNEPEPQAEPTEPTGISLSEGDYDNIAQRLFDKGEEKKKREKEEKEQRQNPQATPVTAEVKLTDEDRQGIASYLHDLTKQEADTADKERKQKEQDKKDKDHKPEPAGHLLDRPLFSIGGGKRAAG